MMAFIRVIALALALVTSSTWCTHPSERNQYEAREDSPQPQPLAEATVHPPEVQRNTKPPTRHGFIQENAELKSRRKRSYAQWSGQVVYSVPYQSISVWKPPTYQLSRPYFIPIYGSQGRIPIYYPPQPLYINSGAPKDNPAKRPFKGPSYLPPVETSTTSKPMKIDDRFNGGDNYDDMPIWDLSEQSPTRAPTTAVVPTRKTRPPGVPKTPPLVHNPTDPEDVANEPEPQLEYENTATPPPVASAPTNPYEPSRCVWAIISCCSSSAQVSYNCFEQRGCPGAFWDDNPCDSEFARAAIAAALNYYNNK